jgi:hypothetical protein
MRSLLFLLMASCMPAAAPRPPPPPVVSVRIVNATVAPAKLDGTAWDGLGGIVPTLTAGAATAMGANTDVAIVVAHVTGEALSHFTRPDPYGWAESRGARVDLKKTSDTLSPSWNAPPLRKITLDGTARVRVHLMDHDLDADDTIGDVELSDHDLRLALAAGKVHQLRVDDQTHGQVLFIGVSVEEER